jgi:hypothetical protein
MISSRVRWYFLAATFNETTSHSGRFALILRVFEAGCHEYRSNCAVSGGLFRRKTAGFSEVA